MKIILFGLNGRGGMLHYTSQFANELARKHTVHVVLPSYSDKRFFDKAVKLIRIDAPPNVMGTVIDSLKFWQHLRLLRQINKLRPDVIHFMDNHPWYLVYAHSLRRFRICVTQHDPELHSGEAGLIRGFMINRVNDVLRRRAKKVIVHGEKLKKMLTSKGIDKDKIVVVPHGSYEFFTKFIRKKIPVEKHTILFFGRIVKYKGVDNLLKAVPEVLKEIPDLKVIIAGEGDFGQYEQYLADEIRPNVEVINRYIPEEEVAELFQRAAFVVLPYDDATQSGVIPIAYSFRKPVITTRVGSLPEVVDEGKTGLIITPKQPKALSSAILTMFGMDLILMGDASYKKMRTIMGWDVIIKKITDRVY